MWELLRPIATQLCKKFVPKPPRSLRCFVFVIRSLLVWGQVQRIICKSRREFRYDQDSPSWVGLVFPKIKKDTKQNEYHENQME
uniref:Uncharacterized protein n=1 Tax=Leptospira santarosai serovar Arenal str. MAVJ 401 TaxID=1049976 RepID=M6K764_9LEPT|nr:hypothetical protein LEP1GSC063_4288 [Leptospira santarosai serovar Arenal str. MAVJ 401]